MFPPHIKPLYLGYLLSCLILSSGCQLLFPHHIPYRFVPDFTHSLSAVDRIFFDDVDGDNNKEFWIIANENKADFPNQCVLYDESFSTIYWQYNDPLVIDAVIPVHRIEQRGYHPPPYFLISRRGRLDAWLKLVTFENKLVWEKHVFHSSDPDSSGSWDGNLIPFKVADLNSDGKQEVLVAACAYFDRVPRGLWAFNLETGDTLWTFPTAGPIDYDLSNLRDFNADGQLELFFGTSAPGNGAKLGVTDDAHSYFFVLNAATGKALQGTETGTCFSHCAIGFLDRKEEGCFLATVCNNGAAGTGFSRLSLWNQFPGQPSKVITIPERLSRFYPCDYRGDGKEEILAGIEKGGVAVFNLKGENIAEYPYQESLYLLNNFYMPVLGDARVYAVRADAQSNWIIISQKLRPLLTINQPEIGSIVPLDDSRLALVSDKIVQFGHIQAVSPPFPLREVILLGIGAIIVILVLLIHSYYCMPLSWKMVDQEFPCSLIWLDRKGRIKKANQIAKTTWPEVPEKAPAFMQADLDDFIKKEMPYFETKHTLGFGLREQRLQCQMRSYRNGILLTIKDQTAELQAKFLRDWGSSVSHVVHWIKDPASNIEMMIHNWKGTLPAASDIGRVQAESKKIKERALRFKRFIKLLELERQLLGINALTNRTLLPYYGKYTEDLKIEFIIEDQELIVNADKTQIEVMLSNLLDNAAEAMEGKGTILLSTRRVEFIKKEAHNWIQRYIEIEIRDDGPGMSPTALEKALEIAHSTKGGMGLGLPQAKLIAELHGGEFEIRSQLGVGTTIYIRLPLYEAESA
jgi:outer membrane protein assembly factor BamB/anti-sigma regulatory factor (Ser/Thr protein kinase)